MSLYRVLFTHCTKHFLISCNYINVGYIIKIGIICNKINVKFILYIYRKIYFCILGIKL